MGGTSEDRKDVKPALQFVAPDGGWGWMIVFSSALSNVVIIPIMQSFGLLFKDKLLALGMTTTDIAIIINVNSAFGMGLGLFNGALLRRFSFRIMAMVGSLLVFSGVIGLTFANSFLDFLLMYGFITSFGTILCLSSNSLALNTYFKKRRGRAAGFSLTATGLGPILMPQLLSVLMPFYGIQGTTLVLAGLSLHAFMASLLLQPVLWHVKSPEILENEMIENGIEANEEGLEVIEEESELKPIRRRHQTITSDSISIEREVELCSMYGIETPLLERRTSCSEILQHRERPSMTARSISVMDESTSKRRLSPSHAPYEWWNASVDTVNLESSVKIFENKTSTLSEVDGEKAGANEWNGLTSGKNLDQMAIQNHTQCDAICSNKKQKPSLLKRCSDRIVVFFDLDLLSDPRYVSLMIGMSLASSAELNFSLFTPFIMGDLGFSTNQIAAIMSTIAASDIIFRFIGPYVGDFLKFSAKHMYTISLVMLIFTRTCLTLVSSYQAVLVVCVFLGIAKGFRSVYMTLVIPAYVPLERLAAASGIQMVTNSLFIMTFGTLIGRIRDWSGNFNTCIMALNVLSLATVTMWILEDVITIRSRKKSRKEAVRLAKDEANASVKRS